MCIGGLINSLAFPFPDPSWGAEDIKHHPGLVQLSTSQNEGFPCVHVKVPNARFTMLYSHGNAEDVSISLDYLEEMAYATQCNIFAYDYVGYSLSALQGFKPTPAGCLRAIEAAWRYLVLTLGISASKIVIIGRSIGSGPAIHLASQKNLHLPSGVRNECKACRRGKLSCEQHGPASCAGVIVQSGIESGGRVAFNHCISIACFPLDIFRNYRAMPRIKSPCAIMHGTIDEVVPISNGKALYRLCRKPVEPLWLEGFGHNDLPPDQCFTYIRGFLQTLEGSGQASLAHAHLASPFAPRTSYYPNMGA